jgi:hypothetical protein
MSHTAVLLVLIFGVTSTAAGTFGCGPWDICRWTDCKAFGAHDCAKHEKDMGYKKCGGWGTMTDKRKCCVQSSCTTRDDRYDVWEDTQYTMAVLGNDDAKTQLTITSNVANTRPNTQ